MAYETEITTLGSSPVDLHDGVNPDAPTGEWRAVENTGTTALLYRESAAIPVLADGGHALNPGDVAVLLVTRSLWVWAPGSVGEIVVSAGAPSPVRSA